MQGAPRITKEEQEKDAVPYSNSPEDRVSHWVNKGFLALTGIATSLLILFGGWIITSLNSIAGSTDIIAVQFAATQKDIVELKGSVDNLRIRGENWATKDSMNASKEVIMEQISKLKDQVNILELRVQRMENSPPPPRAR